jgi:signal transduction histidine kinase/ligand-binding sensor domain-containing protein/DNA-binding NarL/FixJ family response regulator/HPt (histidine-containing phosphotransfer) domain-containing protein
MLLCALLPAAPAGAAPARTLRFEQLGVGQGLAQESVLAIAQDRQGFMWFGSQAGLSRFDGYRTTVYRNIPGDASSLADNWVRALHVDAGGVLWVGTDGGLDRFDPVRRSFTHFAPGEPGRRGNGNLHVRAIVDDAAGGFWLATLDGLQRFSPASGRFTIWHHDKGNPASLRDDQVNALARDAGGRLWVGTASGLDMLAPGSDRFEHWDIDPAPASRMNAVQTLLVDADRNLWIGTLAGVERWRLGEGAPQRSRFGPGQGIVAGAITSIYQDAEANVWIGSYTDGLFCWLAPLGRFAQYRHQPGDSHSVAANQIGALFRDRVGTLWVGTWYDGVSRVDLGSGGFARLTKTDGIRHGLSDNKVHAMAEDRTGTLWLGTHAGLNRLDPASGALRVYRHDPRQTNSLADDDVTALWQGRGDTLWIGGNAGLNLLNTANGRFGRLSLAQGDAASDIIRSISGDRAGKLWVASRGGLHRVDPDSGAFQTFRHDPADSSSLADNMVRPVLEDSGGALWVGTFHGLDLMDRKSGRFRHFRHARNDPASLSHDEVHALYEDKQGTLWVGTANGLNRMERSSGSGGVPRFRRYLRQDGMADDAIFGILGDDANGLWVSTNSGISRLDTRTGLFSNYDGDDGIVEGAYFDGSALHGRDGTLYFGGFNGITAFAPKAVSGNSVAPPVAITDFQIFNKSVEAGRGDFPDVLREPIERTAALTLSEAASVFSLEFSALHYAAPQHNRYAYQLQGFDHDWVLTDAGKRFATYTNLDPGHYIFRVKAASKDGVWSEAAATLAITILPPFWKTWWCQTLLGALLLGGAYAAYQGRMRGMRRQRGRLEQQVNLRTAEVEQKNRLLLRQEKQVRRHTEELALANRALQENDERLRLAKWRAEQATEQKSVFLANMSHEMRTPLAGVIGMLGLALRDQDLHAGTRGQIQRGQANAESLLAIINDLLDLSKIEAGKLGIETLDFALGAAIEDVLGLFEEQAAGIGFSAELAEDLPPFVVGDPNRLRQVLINLIGNAFKFTERGAVKLCVERAGVIDGVSLIRFIVHDTGIGIEAEAVARLFQKFEQADSTTTRRYGGTGLGLAICRQLVELMGGQIAVTSAPGAGSRFTFVLPLPEGVAPVPMPMPAPRLAPHRYRLRVLCAEDFPTNQIIVRMLLEALGHQVEVVANGALAVAACARAPFDLILMDARMPEMDGASAARLIRAGGPGHDPVFDPDVMIVALTANAGDEDRARYLAAGMDDFLSKPIEEAALHSVLDRAIGRQLRRGMVLQPMSGLSAVASPDQPDQVSGAAPLQPCIDELDTMFGVAPSRQRAGGDLKQRIRLAFAADVGPRLGELERAVALRDGETAAVLLHGLKGSAAYLDEDELQRLCAQLELAADLAEWPSLEAALPRLRRLAAGPDRFLDPVE